MTGQPVRHILSLSGGKDSAWALHLLRSEPRFMRITGGGLRESHPNDVTITREAPNYHA